jgi:hypothetical protein
VLNFRKKKEKEENLKEQERLKQEAILKLLRDADKKNGG